MVQQESPVPIHSICVGYQHSQGIYQTENTVKDREVACRKNFKMPFPQCRSPT